MSKLMMSWADRFAVIDHYNPSDPQICSAFSLTQDELATARQLRQAGTFSANTNLDVAKYAHVFAAASAGGESQQSSSVSGPPLTQTISNKPVNSTKPSTAKTSSATVHAKPESAARKVREPQKRGRKGDKIARALAAVPTTQTPVEEFRQQYGVSLAVLRQSKRFIALLDPETAKSIGKINVRQDKTTKTLMIWREQTAEKAVTA